MAKFAHIADCHLGGWRDDRLRVLGLESYKRAVDTIIGEQCDFVVIAGDFFNNAMPHIDTLKHATKQLARLSNNGIPVYYIAGSHDYSPSGRSMLHVLENANLMIDVQKATISDDSIILEYTIDKKTGIKITGLPGKKGALEKDYYKRLDYDSARDEDGTKIFLFHMLLEEFNNNSRIDDIPMSILPQGFDYYAGGHPHIVRTRSYDKGIIAYPGPLFPNNFQELESLKEGGFYIVDVNEHGKCTPKWHPINIRGVVSINIVSDNMSPEELTNAIISEANNKILEGNIVLLRISGLLDGSISDIVWSKISSVIMSRGAYSYTRNTYGLYQAEKEDRTTNIEPLGEDQIIIDYKDHYEGMSPEDVKMIFGILSQEKREGETLKDYNDRVASEVLRAFSLDDPQGT
ncbi:MAG: metallophosphoesterase family protein [Candidatus Woesearchaeota archaeon]